MIVGASGCGKSTLLDLLTGLIPLQKGSVQFSGRNTVIGYMLQKDHLLEYRTIYQNVILGLEIKHQLTKKNISYVRLLMEKYGILDFANVHPGELSGGMRQRAALIRTLACRPELLLLDEPFSALDYQTRLNVTEDVRRIIREQNITTLLVTHDLSEAISTADRIIVLGKRPGHIQSIIPVDFQEAGYINAFIFSSPSRIITCRADLLRNGVLLRHISITLSETFLSFFLVSGISLLFAVILWWNRTLCEILEPYMVILNSLPQSAMAPIFIVWLGNNAKTIIVSAVSVALFGSILNLFTCFASTDPDKLKLIRALGGTRMKCLYKVVIPINLPSILSIMKVDIGLDTGRLINFLDF